MNPCDCGAMVVHESARYVLIGGGMILAAALAAVAGHLILKYWLEVSMAREEGLNKKQLARLKRESYWDRNL